MPRRAQTRGYILKLKVNNMLGKTNNTNSPFARLIEALYGHP